MTPTRFTATIELAYNGPLSRQQVLHLLSSTLEHCRQESMLSDPENLDLACEQVEVIEVTEV